jgi:hypothetical protein
MYPHERSLVKRLEGKPFALIGVNSDTDREAIKTIVQKVGISWRSFWNGGSTRGPIATAWNVHSWPTIYVLDAKGVIRAKDVQEEQLDEAVNKLIQEMQAGAAPD